MAILKRIAAWLKAHWAGPIPPNDDVFRDLDEKRRR